MSAILQWFAAHPRVVTAGMICAAVVMIAALVVGADVMQFFRWFGEVVGGT